MLVINIARVLYTKLLRGHIKIDCTAVGFVRIQAESQTISN